MSGKKDSTNLSGRRICLVKWQVDVKTQCEVRYHEFGVTLFEIIALSPFLSLFLPVSHMNFPLSSLLFAEVFRTYANLMLCYHEMIVTIKIQFANTMVTM